MSYISQIATRRMALVARASMVQTPRQFSTSIAAQKSATEAVKDGLKTVDRKVSDKLVDGINASTSAAEKVAQKATGAADANIGGVKASAEELRGKAKGKTEELKGEAKGAAKEAEGKVKGSL